MKLKQTLVGTAVAALLAGACPAVAFADGAGSFTSVPDYSETVQADAADVRLQVTEAVPGEVSIAWNPGAFNPRNYDTKNMWCELFVTLPDQPGWNAARANITDPNLAAYTFTDNAIQAGERYGTRIKCHQQNPDTNILNVVYTGGTFEIPAKKTATTHDDVRAPVAQAVARPGAPKVYGHKLGKRGLEFYATGRDFSDEKKLVTLRLYRGHKLVETHRSSYAGSESGVDVRFAKLQPGRYRAVATIKQAGKTSKVSKAVKIRL